VNQIAHARAARWPGLEADDLAQEMFLSMWQFGEHAECGDGMYIRVAERDASQYARKSHTYNQYVGWITPPHDDTDDAIILDATDLFAAPGASPEEQAEHKLMLEALIAKLDPEMGAECGAIINLLAEGFCTAEIARNQQKTHNYIARRINHIRQAAVAVGLG
jgi:DNA-directed RNA polymerase specialized sigma24 family protein